MNKIILCYISDSEADEYLMIIQNITTYNTLLKIKEEKGTMQENDYNLINKMKEVKFREFNQWWQKICAKYNIPFFKDKNMYLDAQRNEIYYWE